MSQPFFKENEVTGSIAGLPEETVPAEGMTRSDIAARAATAPISRSISSAPLNDPAIRASSVAQPNVPRAATGGFTVVRAERGDTAYSLSRRYGVSARAIMAANNLTNAEDVRAGQDVRIPASTWRQETAAAAPRRIEPPRSNTLSAPKPVNAAAARPARTDAYVVRSGDTLYSIARRYDLTASDVARHNDMRTNDVLRVGQQLAIPAEGAVRTASLRTGMTDAAKPSSVPSVKPVSAPIGNSLKPLPAPEKVSRPRNAPEPAPKPAAASGKTDLGVTGAPEPKRVKTAAISPPAQTDVPASTGKLPEPPSLTGSSFRWPVRGRLISEFGSKPQGTQNDGINIAVPEGTSVKAAENGVVAYVGNELKGFGNLVLIRHDNDWVTAYAHNSQILVRRGQQISRGQIIAKAGQTGSVRQPQLHFELRKGSRPVDPIQHLAEND